MTEIVIIAAVAQNRVIGRGSAIPWRIREDWRRFKRLTMGHPCIMGDVTYESLPGKSRPLPGRENIVLTFNRAYQADGVTVFHDFATALEYVRQRQDPRAFVTGGASVYRVALPVADTLELTRIHADFAGDVLFPEVNWAQWELVARTDAEGEDQVSRQTMHYSFLTYRRQSATARPGDQSGRA